MHEMFDRILAKGRNEDGLLYVWFNPQTGEHSHGPLRHLGLRLRRLLHALAARQDRGLPRRRAQGPGQSARANTSAPAGPTQSADGFADSIEGAINLFNREPVASAADWIDSQTRMMWAIQKPDGIIEGWHGDGNFARTSLMYALWKTQGVHRPALARRRALRRCARRRHALPLPRRRPAVGRAR